MNNQPTVREKLPQKVPARKFPLFHSLRLIGKELILRLSLLVSSLIKIKFIQYFHEIMATISEQNCRSCICVSSCSLHTRAYLTNIQNVFGSGCDFQPIV